MLFEALETLCEVAGLIVHLSELATAARRRREASINLSLSLRKLSGLHLERRKARCQGRPLWLEQRARPLELGEVLTQLAQRATRWQRPTAALERHELDVEIRHRVERVEQSGHDVGPCSMRSTMARH